MRGTPGRQGMASCCNHSTVTAGQCSGSGKGSGFIICEAASGKQPQQNEVNVQVRRWLAEVQKQARRLEMRYEFEIRNLDFKKCGSKTVQVNFFDFKKTVQLSLYGLK